MAAIERQGLLICGGCLAHARIEVRPDACFTCGERELLYVVWVERGATSASLRLERPPGRGDGGHGTPPNST